MLSTYHVICSPCHLFTIMVHAIHLCHPVINSPCHPVTLSSIHPAINSHLPCRPFTMSSVRIMVHAIHLPCHPFAVLAGHHVYQALSHHITPRCRDPRISTRNSSLSCWRPPWQLPLSFFYNTFYFIRLE